MIEGWKHAVLASVLLTREFDLACVGISISGLSAMTLESIAYLVSADVVLAYPVSPAHDLHLRSLNANVVNLNDNLYAVGRNREGSYESVIALALGELRRGNRVCYAQQGSPTFLSLTGTTLRRSASREGYRVVVSPGVSSFECILTHLCERHDLYDVQLLNCGTLMKEGQIANPRLPLLLFNLVTYAGERVAKNADELDPQRVESLSLRLSEIYSPEHPVHLLSVLPGGLVRETIGPIEALASLLQGEPAGASMFLPTSS